MTADRRILNREYRALVDEGWRCTRTLKEDGWLYAVVLRKWDMTWYMVAKESIYDGRASFLEAVVQRATDRESMLILYVDEQDEHYVFEPNYVAANGTLSTGESKKRLARWLEVPMDEGVKLTDYRRQRDRPTDDDHPAYKSPKEFM